MDTYLPVPEGDFDEEVLRIILSLSAENNVVVSLFKEICETGSRPPYYDPESHSKKSSYPISSTISALFRILLQKGILQSNTASSYRLAVDLATLQKALESASSFLSENVTFNEVSRDPTADGDRLIAYFIRAGNKLKRIRRLASRILRIGEVDFIFVQRKKIDDLVLLIVNTQVQATKEGSSDVIWFSWLDKDFVLKANLKFGNRLPLSPTSGEAGYRRIMDPSELAYYEIDPEDSVKVTVSNDPYYFDQIKRLDHKLIRLQALAPGQDEHNTIKQKLAKLGKAAGYDSETEVQLNGGFKLDCAWFKGGVMTYAFEVQVSGSFLEAIHRLKQSIASNKFLVVTSAKWDQAGKFDSELKSNNITKIKSEMIEDANEATDPTSALGELGIR